MTVEEARAALAAVKKFGTVSEASRQLGVGRSTLKERVLRAPSVLAKAKATQVSPQDALRDKVFELEAEVKSIRTNALTDRYVKSKIIGLKDDLTEARVPTWAVAPGKDVHGHSGVPIALWSDWHAGEVVEPSQIGGVNKFDMEIFHARARRLVERTIYLLRQHVVNPHFPGIVVNLGGDMLTGDIHEELTATNEKPTLAVLLDLYGVLRWAIGALADEFGHVFVPCVTGNHGRNTRKPRAKDRNYTNFDWLLYQFLAKSFAGDKRVQFYIPDGPDALYKVYGHRYLLTHGDQFRGGDGIIGPIGPITRGNKRKLARNSAIKLEYDTMLLGHWHTYMPLHRQIVNGSLKGYDEYANQSNFDYEPPIQALWLTHPDHGITFHMPVYLEAHAGKRADNQWISWKE